MMTIKKRLLLVTIFLLIIVSPQPYYFAYIENYGKYIIEYDTGIGGPLATGVMLAAIPINLYDKLTFLNSPETKQEFLTQEFIVQLNDEKINFLEIGTFLIVLLKISLIIIILRKIFERKKTIKP